MPASQHSTLSPERAANLAENPYAGQGSVLLDIGGDVGAVILHLPPPGRAPRSSTGGTASPTPTTTTTATSTAITTATSTATATHVAVVGRPAGDRIAYSAVFPELVAGRYVLSLPDGSEIDVDVEGGVVTELDRVGEGPVA